MAALLTFGRLSNHLGRRPVSIAALLITAAGTLVLTSVHTAWPLLGGRAMQGIGCGLASSALAAYIVDSAPTSHIGLGYGALAALGLAITLLSAKEPAVAQADRQATGAQDLPRHATVA
jgi:MFS family permease